MTDLSCGAWCVLWVLCVVWCVLFAHVAVLRFVLQAVLEVAYVIRIGADQFVRPLNIVRYDYQHTPIADKAVQWERGKDIEKQLEEIKEEIKIEIETSINWWRIGRNNAVKSTASDIKIESNNPPKR